MVKKNIPMKDDGEYWRISYMVPNLTVGLPLDGKPEHTEYTYIVPQLKSDTHWRIPGGRLGIGNIGLRALEPSSVMFVKRQQWAHFSFEVVLKSLFVSP